MKANTFFQVCIFTCIALVIFTLSINFVDSLNVFGVPVQMGFEPEGTANETFEQLTNVTYETQEGITLSGMDALWMIILGGGVGIGLVVAWLTHSTSILGVFVFSSIFWASYARSLGVLNVGGLLDPISGFILIGTVAMGFVWAGAVAGMLSGSG